MVSHEFPMIFLSEDLNFPWQRRKVPRPASNDMALVFELMEGPTLHESWPGNNLKSISSRMFSGNWISCFFVFGDFLRFLQEPPGSHGINHAFGGPDMTWLQENDHSNTGCPKEPIVTCAVSSIYLRSTLNVCYHSVPKKSMNEYHHFAGLSESHLFGRIRHGMARSHCKTTLWHLETPWMSRLDELDD